VSARGNVLSNFLAGAFDSACDALRRTAMASARRALPQRCELCTSPSRDGLVCAACAAKLPRLVPACPICALPNPGGETCGSCLARPPAFDATLAAYAYAFPIDRLVHALKYQGRLALATWCSDAIVSVATACATAPDCVVALPLSTQRQRERGYNQATEITRHVAARTGIRMTIHGARRVRATLPQTGLPWNERAKNVRGAFACGSDFSGLKVAVVDDVMTTGATLAEFAKTLKRGGATHVQNWIVARTPPARDA
jgi:ComF family protein